MREIFKSSILRKTIVFLVAIGLVANFSGLNRVYALKVFSIGDYVWEDLNENGIQDDGDVGVEGVKVLLYGYPENEPGPWAEPRVAYTDDTGHYKFPDLHPGDYRVEFVKPDGYEITQTNVGGDDNIDSDGLTPDEVFYGPNHPDDLSYDLGLIKNESTYKLGDYVWYDDNKNGIQDDGEKGVEGVKVVLKENDDPIDETHTDANGKYEFTDVSNGDYTLEFSELPGGYEPTMTDVSDTTDLLDSDGLTPAVTIADQDNMSLDLGIVKKETSKVPTEKAGSVKKASPDTGDESNRFYGWIALIIALAVMAVLKMQRRTVK